MTRGGHIVFRVEDTDMRPGNNNWRKGFFSPSSRKACGLKYSICDTIVASTAGHF